MKKIFVSHPFGGRELNKQIIGDICRKLVNFGVMPVSPVHMYSFMNDNNRTERKMAMEFCEEIIGCVDELWLFGKWEKSEGRQRELSTALLELIPARVVVAWDEDNPIFATKEMPSTAMESERKISQHLQMSDPTTKETPLRTLGKADASRWRCAGCRVRKG